MTELIEPRVPATGGTRVATSRSEELVGHGHFTDAFRRAEPGLRRGGCDDHGRDAGGVGRDRGAVSAGAVGPAADAAPGAERRRAGDAGGDRGLRGDPRADRGRGQRGGHLLHDVQAAAGRGLSRRGLHHRALRDHGRRRGVLGPARSSRDRQRRDDRGRQDHPRAHRVQCRLRLRSGDDGQLGVLRQHHAPEGDRRGRHDPRRPRDHRHAGGSGLHLAAGRTGARRLPRRPRRRRPDRGRTLAARSEHRPGARLVRTLRCPSPSPTSPTRTDASTSQWLDSADPGPDQELGRRAGLEADQLRARRRLRRAAHRADHGAGRRGRPWSRTPACAAAAGPGSRPG